MSSNKKSFKLNKTKSQQKNSQNNSVTQVGLPKSQTNRLDALVAEDNSSMGFSVHKTWPDLQLSQSHLFFECTLFLYSVLALFLQYLNLYRTLWWLPKSHWPSSLKYHLINPYILSCIGLLLGVRVTKCFWDAITERIDFFSVGQNGWKLTCWKVFEYAIVKTPLTTIVSTSFMFSFTRIYLEFGIKSFLCFTIPFVIYLVTFRRGLILPALLSLRVTRPIAALFYQSSLTELSDYHSVASQQLLDLDAFTHLCKATAVQIREEATVLLRDFELRWAYSIYTGLLTAYFAIFMPRIFLPQKTVVGVPQFMLIDDVWVLQLFGIVALTSFSLYFTYLFPINYFDLLYRCVVHLGHWELVHSVSQPNPSQQQQQRVGFRMQQNEQQQNESYDCFSGSASLPYQDGTRLLYRGDLYVARSHAHYHTVSAEPGNNMHFRLYKIAKNPVALASYMCIFQCSLVAFEFWLLLLTNDWQQIVTLVLLMFANYLLLAKMFKDRVIIDRIYNPSDEDLHLIKQLQEESEQPSKEIGKRKLERNQKR